MQVQLEVPKRVTPRQEELLRELADEEHTNVSPHRKSFLERLRTYSTAADEAETTED